MKVKTWLLVGISGWLLFGWACQTNRFRPTTPSAVKVMTYNIRLDAASDGPDNWHQRKADLAAYIQTQHPDFLGVQEALWPQLRYLDSLLTDYDYIGVGRDDGVRAGEFMALFYKTDDWQLTRDSTFWLSATPGVCSRGWDAACHRTATVGDFRHASGQSIHLVNTHLDHVGQEARRQSIQLLTEHFKKQPSSIPSVLLGDFNFAPNDDLYQQLAASLTDTYTLARQRSVQDGGTWNGFRTNGPFERRIDYIFVRPQGVTVDRLEIDQPRTANNRQLSDHFPVIANLQL